VNFFPFRWQTKLYENIIIWEKMSNLFIFRAHWFLNLAGSEKFLFLLLFLENIKTEFAVVSLKLINCYDYLLIVFSIYVNHVKFKVGLQQLFKIIFVNVWVYLVQNQLMLAPELFYFLLTCALNLRIRLAG
jgi:hypothetical protein